MFCVTLSTSLICVLEYIEFARVGGTQTIKSDTRVLVATNKDLLKQVEARVFREDLYYRLKVITINAPPLREHKEDIPHLLHRFVEQFCRENNCSFRGFTEATLKLLFNYHWPGNIRELKNLVQSLVILAPPRPIEPIDLPDNIFVRKVLPEANILNVRLGMSLKEIEKDVIIKTLSLNKNNRQLTAKTLGIGVRTLYRKLKEYNLN